MPEETNFTDSTAFADSAARWPFGVLLCRLAIGLGQGLVGVWLIGQSDKFPSRGGWLSHYPLILVILWLLVIFIPIIALAEAGRMRWRGLGVYLLALAGILTMLAYYAWWRSGGEGAYGDILAPVVFGASIGCFIANKLLEHHTSGYRLWHDYATYFENSWMRGFQFVLALLFALLVWGVLLLGNALFQMIHMHWYEDIILNRWCLGPMLTVAFAASVHITDVRPALLTGIRNLGLTLLAWLLPLVVVLGWGFLAALLFTGLAPLWATGNAGMILMSSAGVALILINAAYKDGLPEHHPVAPIRWMARAAAWLILLLMGLAAYGIGLRVLQYGWTPQRVVSAVVVLVGLMYGGGYSWAALGRRWSAGQPWLKGLERVNIFTSMAIIVLLLGLFSPVLDPARVSVASQVARLQAGKVAADHFDYSFLQNRSARYGQEAFAALQHSPNPAIVQEIQRRMAPSDFPDPAPEPAFSHAGIYPRGAVLPASFRNQPWSEQGWNGVSDPGCLTGGKRCDIIIWPQGGTAMPLLFIIPGSGTGQPEDASPPVEEVHGRRMDIDGYAYVVAWGQSGGRGRWSFIGTLHNVDCPGVVEALRGGHFGAAAVRAYHSDIQINQGIRLPFTDPDDNADTACSVTRSN